MRLKALIILLLIIVSLLPFHMAGQYLDKKLQPRSSFRRFATWMLLMLVLIFIYTFVVVFIIRMLFPGA